jgi:hypothetical protein
MVPCTAKLTLSSYTLLVTLYSRSTLPPELPEFTTFCLSASSNQLCTHYWLWVQKACALDQTTKFWKKNKTRKKMTAVSTTGEKITQMKQMVVEFRSWEMSVQVSISICYVILLRETSWTQTNKRTWCEKLCFKDQSLTQGPRTTKVFWSS